MFCSQCGKKVTENMLFCPFCGKPIVIPEQEPADAERAEPSAQPEAPARAENVGGTSEAFEAPAGSEAPKPEAAEEGGEEERPFAPSPAAQSQPEEETPARSEASPRGENAPKALRIDWETDEPASAGFQPLNLDELDSPSIEKPKAPKEELSELLAHRLREEPVQLKGRAPDLSNVHNPDRPGERSRRKASSYAPVRAFDPDDIFMDGDDYDEDDEDEEYAYEEPEEGGFLIRHIRGVVGLTLFVIVLAIVAGWAFSGGGQRVLAQANLAWQPSVYEQLGYEAYQNGQYAVAAGYYEQALGRDERNYSYAYSAGVASYMAGDTQRAAEMGKRAVEIDPSRLDGYQLLQRLYPDAASRPWEIQSLIQQGYRLTGDASLNDAPQQ